jgi:hypothetical protein
MRKSERAPEGIITDARDFKELAEAARGIVREIQNSPNRIDKDTLLIYVDKSGRFARVPIEEALKEKGAKLPQKRYFLNFSVHDQFFKSPWKKNKEIDKYIREGFKKIGGYRQFRNIVIVDEHAAWGATLHKLKKRFELATGKPVATIALGSVYKPIWYPDYFGKTERVEYLTDMMRLQEKPVKDRKVPKPRPAIVLPEPNKKALPLYAGYIKGIKEEFAKTEPPKKPTWYENLKKRLQRKK